MGTFAVGPRVAIHLAMNGAAGAAVGNPSMANAVFWCVGAVAAVPLTLTGYDAQVWPKAGAVSPWLWTAGVAGASLVSSVAWLIPRLGAGTVDVTFLTGPVLAA